jgi:hypothetical protein
MLTALLLTTATFPGGSANDFADFLHLQTSKSVVIAQAYMRPVEKAELEPDNLNELARGTRAKTHLRFVAGSDMILQDELLPPERMAWTTVKERVIEPKWVEVSGMKDGKLTFRTTGDERLDPLSLEKAKFSRPVSVHWMLGKYALSVRAQDLDERTFLTYVAKATGGFLQINAKGYRLELDSDQLRKRALNMLALSLKNDPLAGNPYEGVQGRIEILTGMLEDASKADLATAFATPESKVEVPLKSNAQTMRAMMRMAKASPNSYDPETGALRTPAGPLFLDQAAKAQFVLKATFRGALEFTFKGEEGKPPPFIRIEIGH